jgi:predicted ATPase
MLERIEIENLGAIQKTSVTLSPLTVLVGANASGKTTVMRGIELFSTLRQRALWMISYAQHRLRAEGWPAVLRRGDTTQRLVLRASVQRESSEPDYEMQIGIDWERVKKSIASGQAEGPPIGPEFLAERVRDPGHGWIEAGVGPYFLRSTEVGSAGPRSHSVAATASELAKLPTLQADLADLTGFLQQFGKARYFRPSSTMMLRTGMIRNNVGGVVKAAGEGFVDALALLQNRQAERFNDVEQHLRALFPHIRHVRFDVDRHGRRLLFETHRSERLTPADLEADGVLTTLFLLWAGATTPPHGTLLIDEPEAALHPHLMGKRIEFLRSLANGEFTGQPIRVVAATQSVDFVRWLDTSEIRVVEYSQETGTRVHAIPESETLHALTDKFQANAGDLWYSGAIGGTPGTEE